MLSDEQLLLIASALDGDLSPTDIRKVRRLLRSSPEAMAVYLKLKSDRRRLRRMPKPAVPGGLHQTVMARIAALATTPQNVPGQPVVELQSAADNRATRRQSQTWIPLALAASLLMAIGATSFWYFNRDPAATAHNTDPRPPINGSARSGWDRWLPAGPVPPTAPMPAEKLPTDVAAQQSPTVAAPGAVERAPIAIAPMPQEGRDPLFAPLFPPTHLDMIQARVPFLKSLADFEREDIRLQFKDELSRDPAFRIDLFTRDTARAIQLVQSAAKHSGIALHIDSTTAALAAKRQTAVAVALYCESLTAAELMNLLTRLNTEDARISPRLFDVLHATAVVKQDETDLRNILGVDPGLLKRAAPASDRKDSAPDHTRPVSAGTADQIVKSITAGQKSAILLTWAPSNLRTMPANSAELKSFLARRGDRLPNAIPVIIVIRHGNG